jgi:hypothetical protein
MNILLTILFCFTLNYPSSESFLDINDDVSAAIKTGNASNVAKFFPANIDLKVPPNKENLYSKAQAELILKDFFGKNPVKLFSIIHKSVSKNGDVSVIGSYETASGKKFRTYSLFKKEGNKLTFQQLRFDVE